MTITSTSCFTTATGNGATTSFPFDFPVSSPDDVDVMVNGALQGSGFTVTVDSDGNGGTVSFTTPPVSGAAVLLALNPSFMQAISFENAGAYNPASVDNMGDEGAVRDIYLKGRTDRSIRAPVGETLNDMPDAASRAGQFLAFDSGGNPIAISETITAAAGATVSTRIALGNIAAPANLQSALLAESGREGTFTFDSSDLSAEVAADAAQGVYVAPSSDVTGASGAWMRADKIIRPYHFGAVGDGVTDDSTALDAFNAWIFAEVRTDRIADCSGNFGYSGTFVFGAPADSNNLIARYALSGDMRIVQLTGGTFETVKIQNLGQTVCPRITAQGIGGTSFASRTCGIGIHVVNCNQASFPGLRAYNFWFDGISFESDGIGTGNSNGLSVGPSQAFYCGSGYSGSGQSLSGNWSSPVNNGSQASTAQTTTLTIDTFPDASIETYQAVNTMPVGIIIAGEYYIVKSWDRIAGTINIYPWIDNTSFAAGSGTFYWAFGGGIRLWGSDSNIIQFEHANVGDCGQGIVWSSLYGPKVKSANLTANGVAIVIGSTTTGAALGGSFEDIYTESNDFDIAYIAPRGGNNYTTLTSSYALDFTKCFSLAPRLTAGGLGFNSFGSGQGAGDTFKNGLLLAKDGHLYWANKRSIGNELSTTMTFREQARPPRILTQHVNSQTVTLSVMGSGEYNRLWGYDGCTLRYVGTGTNGAPTGTITFTPPSGGTVNGGAANASVSFSSFTGPADFEVYHTDTAQLTWIARCVAGQGLTATSDLTPASVAATGAITTTAGGVGYATGAGGTVTQATSKSTGVTLNKLSGQVTMNAAALAAAAKVSFTVTNSQVAATDAVIVNVASGGTANAYRAAVTAVAAGSFTVTVENITAGSLSESPVIGFAVLKAVTA